MKKLINKIGSITLIMLLAIHFAFAGDKTKVGTVGGVQLLVPVGARSIAMGQAIVADIGGGELATVVTAHGVSLYLNLVM